MSTTGKTKKSSVLFEYVSIIVQALLLALVIRSVALQPFNIPSGSMRPTLLQGDYLFVSKWSYGYSRYSFPLGLDLFSGRIFEGTPQRGDVVVFRFPPRPTEDYIKRLIGLPGDHIQMKDGQLFINGVGVPRVKTGQIKDFDISDHNSPVDVYRETLPNGVSYDTLDLLNSESPLNANGENTREFVVPPGHYFMMGDNRNNSLDSRFDVGYVPAENLIGKANVIFFSIAGQETPLKFWKWPSLVRLSRLFTFVH